MNKEAIVDEEKEEIEDTITESATTLKDKLEHLQTAIISYAKENPVKTIGISLLAGAIVAQIFHSRD